MTKLSARTKLCLLLFALALVWRVLGAPVTVKDFQSLRVSFWQARTLLPDRAVRMLLLWFAPSEEGVDNHQKQAEMITVFMNEENRMVHLPLEEYVRGVVAAEMHAQYHREALKEQAVAARTRVLWKIGQGGCKTHPGSDICTDSAHCQGYALAEECREQWGEEYSYYSDRLLKAQSETEGEWIAYDDQPIAVLYHAISGGRTEDSQTVFAQQLPYLISVESENEENVRGYQQETKWTFEDIARKLQGETNGLVLTEDNIRRTFSIIDYTASGRVKTVQIGDVRIDAADLRRMLGLRSTWFSISADDSGITFYQRGYGHGVGMSQAGANVMAASGADYRQILQHYYTGVSIKEEYE